MYLTYYNYYFSVKLDKLSVDLYLMSNPLEVLNLAELNWKGRLLLSKYPKNVPGLNMTGSSGFSMLISTF